MYRVSVTTLEKFRRFVESASPYDTEESLIESIKGTFAGNDKTKVGAAFHKLIEGDFVVGNDTYRADDIIFTIEQAAVALDFRDAHENMIHEVSLQKTYPTNFGPIQISGRADGLEGMEIHDHKCKFRNVNWREYMDSIQWRFYMDVMEVETFWYNVFEVRGFDGFIDELPPFSLPSDAQFLPHDPLKCSHYLDLENDLRCLINDFMAYIRARDFFSFLKEAKPVPELYE